MAPKKRKPDSSETNEPLTSRTLWVIHFPDSSAQGFTPLTDERLSLSKLTKIRQTRLALPGDSKQCMPEICEQIPDAVEDGYRYHRDCHMRFTAHIRRPSADPDSQLGPSRPPRVPSDERDKYIFNPNCIICGKAGYKKLNKVVHGQQSQHANLSLEKETPYWELQKRGMTLISWEEYRATTYSHVRPSAIAAAGGATPEIHHHGKAAIPQPLHTRQKWKQHIWMLSHVFVPLLMPTFSGRWLWWKLTTYEICTLIIWKTQTYAPWRRPNREAESQTGEKLWGEAILSAIAIRVWFLWIIFGVQQHDWCRQSCEAGILAGKKR